MSVTNRSGLAEIFGARDTGRLSAKRSSANSGKSRADFTESLRAATKSQTASAASEQAARNTLNSATSDVPVLRPNQYPANLGDTSMAALQNACAAEGVSLNGIDVSYANDLVWSPVGSYYNPHIRLTFANGQVANLGADLVMLNPNLAAYEIRQMLDPSAKA